MNIINIGTDRILFENGSEVQQRHVEYARTLSSLELIVFTTTQHDARSIAPNARVHATNSLSRLFYVFDAYRIGRKLQRPDIVTAQDPFECGLAAYLIARYFHVPLELQVHTDIGSPYFQSASMLHRIRMRIARVLIPRAARIRVVSERIRVFLTEELHISRDRIEVRPVAVATDAIKASPIRTDLHALYPQFSHIVLMASRLVWEKHIELAIDALHIVRERRKDIGLVIVGEGPCKQQLQRRVEKLGLSNAIIFTPWTNDLPSYYKTADCLLVTSFYEGYCRTIVEARSVGLPVISTDVGIAKEYGATIVPMSDVRIAAAISATVLP